MKGSVGFPLVAALVLLTLSGCNVRTGGVTPSPPSVVTIPSGIYFFAPPGTSPAARVLGIGVTNRVSVRWSARAEQPWLSIKPANGETPRNFTGALFVSETTVSVDSSTLPRGGYSASISIDVDGQAVRTVPVNLYITDALPGQKIDAEVKAGEGNGWGAGVRLDGPVRVTVGAWDPSLSNPGPTGTGPQYANGDLLVRVEGTLANVSDNDCQVEYWAKSFDSAGKQVSESLDSGNPVGHLLVRIPKQTGVAFVLHLGWAEDVKLIVIGANRYDEVTPLPF